MNSGFFFFFFFFWGGVSLFFCSCCCFVVWGWVVLFCFVLFCLFRFFSKCSKPLPIIKDFRKNGVSSWDDSMRLKGRYNPRTNHSMCFKVVVFLFWYRREVPERIESPLDSVDGLLRILVQLTDTPDVFSPVSSSEESLASNIHSRLRFLQLATIGWMLWTICCTLFLSLIHIWRCRR